MQAATARAEAAKETARLAALLAQCEDFEQETAEVHVYQNPQQMIDHISNDNHVRCFVLIP